MKIVVGPVLGRYSNNCLRVLLECDEPGELSVSVYAKTHGDGDHTVSSFSVNVLERFSPFVFLFENILPGKCYEYVVKHGDDGLFRSAFTMPSYDEPVVLGVVNSDSIEKLGKKYTDMWQAMAVDHLTPDGMFWNVLVHSGNQINETSLNTYTRCCRFVKHLKKYNGSVSGQKLLDLESKYQPRKKSSRTNIQLKFQIDPNAQYNEAQVREMCIDLYRNLYRAAWSRPWCRLVMSSVCNEMICDDHDIRTGFGLMKKDHDPDQVESFVGLCAYRAYLEYCVSLYRQVDVNEAKTVGSVQPEHHHIRIGDSVIYFTDLMTPRCWSHTDSAPFLGHDQLNDLKVLCNDNSILNMAIVTTQPMVLATTTKTHINSYYDWSYDIRETWTWPDHQREHQELLTAINNFKNAPYSGGEINKSLIILAGKIHFSMHSSVYIVDDKINIPQGAKKSAKHKFTTYPTKKEQSGTILDQVVVGPVADEPNRAADRNNQTYGASDITLYSKYSVVHEFRAFRRSYAKVWVSEADKRQQAADRQQQDPESERDVSRWRYKYYVDTEGRSSYSVKPKINYNFKANKGRGEMFASYASAGAKQAAYTTAATATGLGLFRLLALLGSYVSPGVEYKKDVVLKGGGKKADKQATKIPERIIAYP